MTSHTNTLKARLAVMTGLAIEDLEARLLKPQLPALIELLEFLEIYPAGTEQHEEGKNLLTEFSSFSSEYIMRGIKRIDPDYETLEENLMRSIGAPLTTKATGLSNDITELDELLEGQLSEFSRVAKTTPKELVVRIVYKRFSEICGLLEFAEDYPEGSEKHAEVAKLLSNYDGGNYIYEEMKKIDPEYQSPKEWMMSFDDSFLDSLFESVPKTAPKVLPALPQ